MFERTDGPPPPDRIEIADLRVPGPGTGGNFTMRLTEAVYRLRLEWASGQSVEGDIWVKCEPVGALEACVARRVMWDLVDEAHAGAGIRQGGNDT